MTAEMSIEFSAMFVFTINFLEKFSKQYLTHLDICIMLSNK